MSSEKVVVSFSGGKDCTLSLYKMMKSGYEIIGLLVTFDSQNNSCFHKIPREIFNKISEELEIPIFEVDCSEGKVYEEEFEKTLIDLKKRGAEICVFGDIDIEAHRKWCLSRCSAAQIKGEFPLWQQNRDALVNEFIDCGFKAIIKKVNLKVLGAEFLGKELSKTVVDEIKELGCDACGENGEYHTLVLNGPIFKNAIKLNEVSKEIDGDFGYLIINN